ncbi:MAG: ribosome recycling factor [Crocinitomicaceae bacterium]|nr:ribosome recycling factor [Crocinitomicaceae bacterium]
MVEELNMVYDELKNSNSKSIERYEVELTKIRAGKANPAMLQSVKVDYYGSMTPLSQVANVNTMDARTLTVQPWEKAMLDEIMKGITNANLGFSPQSNGESVLINVPPLTEERRRELVKRAKGESENARVSIRTHRKEALDMVKLLKDDGLSEDMQKDGEAEIQNITNSFSTKIDSILEFKEKDIMTI